MKCQDLTSVFSAFVGVFASKSKPNKPANHRKFKDTACDRNLMLISDRLSTLER